MIAFHYNFFSANRCVTILQVFCKCLCNSHYGAIFFPVLTFQNAMLRAEQTENVVYVLTLPSSMLRAKQMLHYQWCNFLPLLAWPNAMLRTKQMTNDQANARPWLQWFAMLPSHIQPLYICSAVWDDIVNMCYALCNYCGGSVCLYCNHAVYGITGAADIDNSVCHTLGICTVSVPMKFDHVVII